MLAKNGALSSMIDAGARILECACGPCIGMGQSPATDAVSVRTFNRNFRELVKMTPTEFRQQKSVL